MYSVTVIFALFFNNASLLKLQFSPLDLDIQMICDLWIIDSVQWLQSFRAETADDHERAR